jgi:hypothetical protein
VRRDVDLVEADDKRQFRLIKNAAGGVLGGWSCNRRHNHHQKEEEEEEEASPARVDHVAHEVHWTARAWRVDEVPAHALI